MAKAGRLARVAGIPLVSIVAFATFAAAQAAAPQPAAAMRSIAVTVDDLPASRSGSLEEMRDLNRRLLQQLEAHGIPAIGFVNESKLERPGEEAAREALLAAWLDAGHDLGNHTHRHVRLYDTPLAEFEADVLRGERVTRRLMAARGRTPHWFRHPTLNTGPDLSTKAAFEAFLAEHGYAVAPVTFDNDEYLYAAAYDLARRRGDRAEQSRIGRDYLRYMAETATFYEGLSRRLFGREIPQVLLIHANMLNAEYVGELAGMLRGRGYRFVSLAEAVADPAYGSRDDFVGPRGPSWLQRWAITRAETPGEEPQVPDWVTEAARELTRGR